MSIILLLTLAVIIGVAVASANAKTTGKKKARKVWAKSVLTDREQAMYFRLTEALPEYVVLAQVSFQALLNTHKKDVATRNTFDRKIADFVVCTKAFEVAAIIELDDHSHRGRKKQDKARDAMLKSAGHKLIRYKQIPDAENVKNDIAAVMQSKQSATAKADKPDVKLGAVR